MVHGIKGDRPCQNKQLSLHNVGLENKRRASRGCLFHINGEYNKGQEKHYKKKRTFTYCKCSNERPEPAIQTSHQYFSAVGMKREILIFS